MWGDEKRTSPVFNWLKVSDSSVVSFDKHLGAAQYKGWLKYLYAYDVTMYVRRKWIISAFMSVCFEND